MRKEMLSLVRRFLSQNHITVIDESALISAFECMGFTIIPFHFYENDKHTLRIMHKYHLEQDLAEQPGLLYTDENLRVVFLNVDLAYKERMMVLAHEMGHVYCGHFLVQASFGENVRFEHEANEFAHFLLHPCGTERLRRFLLRHNISLPFLR